MDRPLHIARKRIPRHKASRIKNVDLLVLICDLLAVLFGLAALFSWYGAIVNNPLMLHQSFGANIIRFFTPIKTFIILALLIGITYILSYQNVFKNEIWNGILIVLLFIGGALILSHHYFGTILLSALNISFVISIMALSIQAINKEGALDRISFLIAGGLGIIVYIIFKFLFRLSLLSCVTTLIFNILILGCIWLNKDQILRQPIDNSKENAIHVLTQLPIWTIRNLKRALRKLRD